MREAVTGPHSIDRMVEAAIWLMVQGDRAGAEELLAQALRLNPNHERARQAMKSASTSTGPGNLPAVPQRGQEKTSPGPEREEPSSQPAPMTRTPIGHTTAPGTTYVAPPKKPDEETLPPALGADLPFISTPSSLNSVIERSQPTVLMAPVEIAPPVVNIEEVKPTVRTGGVKTQRNWSLEILTGANAGKSVTLANRPTVIGRGLGAINESANAFIATGHASFFQRDGELWVSDGGSLSGTWLSIDGPHRLSPGDSFSVGLQRLRYLGPMQTAPIESPQIYGAPFPPLSWRLEHLLVGARPARIWLLRGVVTLGRESTTVRFGDDDSMASVHAELRPAGDCVDLIDRSARAGTFVAMRSTAERRLAAGTRVRLGSTVFRVIER